MGGGGGGLRRTLGPRLRITIFADYRLAHPVWKCGVCAHYLSITLGARIASIFASSAEEKRRLASAATFCSTCSTRLAPIRALVMRGSRKTHARASCATD